MPANGILIGKNEVIKWVDFDTSGNDLFELGYILRKYPDFWSALELECVIECCGIDACRFFPEDIINAVSTVNVP